MERHTATGKRQKGVAYLALLLVIAIMGAALGAIGVNWETATRREKERELLFIGNQFRRAIMQYYEGTPGDRKYPMRLEDLLGDPRFLGERRYLRQIYIDPMTQKSDWGLVMAPAGGIMGVYSFSTEAPIKRDSFSALYRSFSEAKNYTEWQFSYVPAN